MSTRRTLFSHAPLAMLSIASLLTFTAQCAHAQSGVATSLTGQIAGSNVSLALTVTNTLPPSAPAFSISAQATITWPDPVTQAQDTATSNTVTLSVAGVNDMLTPAFTFMPFPASLVYNPAPGDATTQTWDSAHATYVLSGTLPAIDGGASESKSFAFTLKRPTVRVGAASVQSQGTP